MSTRRRQASGSVCSSGWAIRIPAFRTRSSIGPSCGLDRATPPRRPRLVGDVRAARRGRPSTSGGVEVARGDTRAEVAQRLRDAAADPARAARDEGDATLDAVELHASPPILEGDPVGLDVVGVELPAEPGRVRQLEHPVDERRAVRDEVPPDRVAVGVEALDDGSVRDRREQVRGDLGLLVVAHRTSNDVRDRRRPPPLGRAARPRRVEVADVDRALVHQVAASGRRELALAGADADGRAEANVAHARAGRSPSGTAPRTTRGRSPRRAGRSGSPSARSSPGSRRPRG